jgi:TPP-dependent pyruvate/acetoin dehydrogenase alpha subunit
MTAKRKATSVNEAKQNENPLISNSKLRQIYTKLVEVRAFDEHFAKMPRRVKSAPQSSIRGQEAPRVSALIDLKPGDLISDSSLHPATELILGADTRHLLKHGSVRHSATEADKTPKQLPLVADADVRLQLAMGAALVLKTAKQGNIVVAFVSPRELSGSACQKLLTLAAQLELPIIFVVLPAASKQNASLSNVSEKARLARVPGIPVDFSDAIALFRVIQESLGRTRGGDGPVVIECLKYTLRSQSLAENDAIVQMGKFLLERKICNQAELDAIYKKSQRNLRSSRH